MPHLHPLRNTLLPWLLGLLLIATGVRAEANLPPREMLEAVTVELLDTLKQEKPAIDADPQHLFTLVEGKLLPHVDLEVMSRYVLGKHWRTASAEQRRNFSEEFKNLMVRFYVSALLDDPKQLGELLAVSDTLINYYPVDIPPEERKCSVRAQVNLPSGAKIPVSFALYRADSGEWMIYDVNVDGISLVTNYRSSFSTEVQRDGLDALITRLANRSEELLQQARQKNGTPEATNAQ